LDCPPDPLSQDPRLSLIAGILQEKKAEDILVLDLRTVSDAADCFVICSASSDPHVKALVTALVESLRVAGHKPWHVEGMEQRRWVLIDLVDIVVHVSFRRPGIITTWSVFGETPSMWRWTAIRPNPRGFRQRPG
jgi:ribosome-associated protein